MRTGRPRTSDVVKRIKGNRRKEKLAEPMFALPPADDIALSPRAEGEAAPPLQSDGVPGNTAAVLPVASNIPDFLTKPREREIYTRIMDEFMPRQIARATDAPAYARYAVYFARWLNCKEILDSPEAGDGYYWVESKHGKRLAEHPAFKMMVACELSMVRLELQLGLTPLSRQSIIRGMGALAAAQAALFGDGDKNKATAATAAEAEVVAPGGEAEPLDWLANAASPIPKMFQ